MKKLILIFLSLSLFLLWFSFWEIIDIQWQENNESTSKIKVIKNTEKTFEAPFVWEINFDSFSLPLLTIIAWLLDWFNPCALFILLFLLSILLTSWDRKKLIILWSTFIIASWIAYFIILYMLLFSIQTVPAHYKSYFQLWVWVLWIMFWLISIYNAFFVKKWCSVMNKTKRDYFFTKIKNVIDKKSILLSMIWIAIIAFLVNFMEMFCTVWIPLTYTTILASQNFDWYISMFYLILYVFFFLLDHFVIFTIAIFTYNIIWVSNKYTKWINLFWWILMLLLWIIIILNPKLLML